ncbi:MAG: undecaprenyl/decaprenyl-phosphate alpha-N-acetylglucosaminyl 1-phosphate transferase [Propionibacteriales bacterium]|nr:undecaprenyl/decaprenyl-phosphate alpha-N-acetylglucosaminyl 1-phosphate transferase [Propionibacteriales bacterium]
MREYVLVLLVAAAATFLLATLAREMSIRIGAVAQVRDRDVHAIPIPTFGGIAMLGGLGVAVLVAWNLPFLGGDGTENMFKDVWVVLLGGTVVCAVGVIDDIFELDAVTKAAGEVVAAGIVVLAGVQFYWVPIPGVSTLVLDPTQAALLSILVIVATVNAVNFVDGLDGLATGVVCIGASAFFGYSYIIAAANNLERSTPAALLTAALIGVCLGILPHNFYPARMFIGDAGALLIGFILACSAITFTGRYDPSSVDQGVAGAQASLLPAMLPLLLPLAILIVPLVDLVLAVVRRTRAGRSPFAPDKRHLHHRLLEIGHSHRRAVLLMYLWASLVAFGALIVSLFTGWRSVLGLTMLLVVAVLLTFGHPRRIRERVPRS